MYIDFPEGRLKLFGTLMFPANKYLVLKFGPKDIVCEDVLESMVRLLIPSILFLAACTPMHTCFTPLHTVLHAQGLGLSALVYTAWLFSSTQVVFPEAWWVGSKEENPTEARLPLPQSIIDAGMKAGGACFAWPFLHAAYLVSFPKEKC